MSVIGSNILAGSSGQGGAAGYEIERSLRFNNGDSAYLNRTPSSAGNRKTWTWAGWVKFCADTGYLYLLNCENTDRFYLLAQNGNLTLTGTGASSFILRPEGVFRDFSAWYHITILIDTTQATDSDRVKIYINGAERGYSIATYPALNADLEWNTATAHEIGSRNGVSFGGIDVYLADVHFIDGQALAPSDFGEYDSNSVWQPKAFGGTYGTNGFHLDFSDTSSDAALGTDTSGNGNTWTVNNLSVAAGAGNDALRDSPTNGTQTDTGVGGEVVGNYATLNSVDTPWALVNGNLEATAPSSPNRSYCAASIYVNSGKWYAEFEVTNNNTYQAQVGVVKAGDPQEYLGISGSQGCGYEPKIDRRIYAGQTTTNLFGQTYTNQNYLVGLALDMDAGTLNLYLSGVFIGQLASGLSGYYTFACGDVIGGGLPSFKANFGQRAFAYTAPSGYKALCTANLDDPTIPDGSTAFDTKLWTGNSSTNTITGLNFSPDFLWIKARSVAYDSRLFDSVRGVDKLLYSSLTSAEATGETNLTSFDSNGFTLDGSTHTNLNTQTFVGWAWDAGSSNTTIAAGSLNSSAYDQSVLWSGNNNASTGTVTTQTGSYYGTSYDALALFDSSTSTMMYAEAGGQWVLWQPVSNYTFTSTVEVYKTMSTNTPTATVTYSNNSTVSVTLPATSGWHTIATGGGVLKSIKMQATTGDWNYWSAVRIDGKHLVDSGVTLTTNVPTIASTVRANPSAGFSIVSYTATSSTGTIGHGLNAAPAFVLCKRRDSTGSWWAGHVGAGWTKGGYLQVADAFAAGAGWWNNTDPDTNVVTLGTYPTTGSTSATYIAYCFAPVEGYSAFGSYTGNGSADGPFVYTGFAVNFLLLKAATVSGTSWFIQDLKRGTTSILFAQLPNQETTLATAYTLSNGFKVNGGASNYINGTGQTYIYAAFAEHPFKNSRAR